MRKFVGAFMNRWKNSFMKKVIGLFGTEKETIKGVVVGAVIGATIGAMIGVMIGAIILPYSEMYSGYYSVSSCMGVIIFATIGATVFANIGVIFSAGIGTHTGMFFLYGPYTVFRFGVLERLETIFAGSLWVILGMAMIGSIGAVIGTYIEKNA